MRKAFSATTEATAPHLFEVVSDLATYPNWLDVVSNAEPTDEPDTWLITLRARVGPFSRSKRLRMVRTTNDRPADGAPSKVRFERREVDGKEHSDWVLAAEVSPLSPSSSEQPPATADSRTDNHRSELELELIYGGGMWSGPLEGVLASAADRATKKLQAYVRP